MPLDRYELLQSTPYLRGHHAEQNEKMSCTPGGRPSRELRIVCDWNCRNRALTLVYALRGARDADTPKAQSDVR